MKYISALALLVLTAAPSGSQVSQTGSIRGSVLTDDGRPLAAATVYGLPESDMRRQVRTTTDSEGKFLLQEVPAGEVYLYAFKERDWYPYNFFAFFNTAGEAPLKVAVQAAKTMEHVVIQLGPRAGALNIEVVDHNGVELSGGVTLTFTRDDMPGAYRRGAGASTRSLLVPAVPFRLTIEAPGYQPWHSALIKPESQRTLDVTARMAPLR